MRQLVQFQDELAVNYCKLAVVSADLSIVQAAFRSGLGAQWQFLSNEQRTVIKQINILDETEGEYAYRAQPYTFVLRPDRTIHTIYNGWFFGGRPTIKELRYDLQAMMEMRSDYCYEVYNAPSVKQIRLPQQEWLGGAPPLGANGLPVGQGVVHWFDLQTGNGLIVRDGTNDEIFFNFTAIPGEGYRTLRAGTLVKFEIVESSADFTARNVQKQ
ncbi:cold shock domain-containing protein [Stenomitos frigidus AS-A4]|uniref:Cold shock domain-containing protein n=1 Tax=Stenomitos frigidus AS-A4 TaxID=2933935 RepID=A0ABV0KT77_9CYAN